MQTVLMMKVDEGSTSSGYEESGDVRQLTRICMYVLCENDTLE